MSKQQVSKQLVAPDVLYKVGEECSHWLKFGDYVQQQAIEDGLLDGGRLTSAGLQAIISEREMAKKRDEKTSAIKLEARSLKNRTKARGISFKTRFSSQTQKQTKSWFVVEVKALLAKIDGKFVHFTEDGENCRLVIRVSAERGGTTSHTFTGSVSDIRLGLGEFIDEIEENIIRKQNR